MQGVGILLGIPLGLANQESDCESPFRFNSYCLVLERGLVRASPVHALRQRLCLSLLICSGDPAPVQGLPKPSCLRPRAQVPKRREGALWSRHNVRGLLLGRERTVLSSRTGSVNGVRPVPAPPWCRVFEPVARIRTRETLLRGAGVQS